MAAMPAAAAPFVALGRDAARVGLRLTDRQIEQCAQYADALIEANRKVNLTAINAPDAIAVKHFLDSFTAYAARSWTGHERLADIGSGAGFPGVALKIALPELAVACVEATGKKARFIEQASDLIGVDVEVRHARAEELARVVGERNAYDIATARALGSLAHCIELLVPFLRVGGDAIVWKGRIEAELAPAQRAASAIGAEVAAVVPTASLGIGDLLPGRSLVVVRKMRSTPDRYPRTAAEMKKRPW